MQTGSEPKLILVRHAAVQIDTELTSHRWPLSAQGRSDCRRLASQLAVFNPTIFVTSTEPKAMETGQILAESLDASWHTEANLHEHDRRGVAYFPNRDAFEAIVADFFARPNVRVFGRETATQALERFDAAVNNVLAKNQSDQSGNLAIVSHGTVISLFLSHYNRDLNPFRFWRSLSLPCYFVVSLPDFTLQL